MARYGIYSRNVISTYDMVEAESPEEAIELRYGAGWPALMFVDHEYPDTGDWEIDEDVEELND